VDRISFLEASAVREKALLRFYSYMGIEFENYWFVRVPEVGSDQEAEVVLVVTAEKE